MGTAMWTAGSRGEDEVTQRIERHEARNLMDQGAQVDDVLPWSEYEHEHLTGAVNLPLRQLDARAGKMLDRSYPVIVYGRDYTCDLSPRAAVRLTQLGFAETYDYVPGKADWMAAGLPREGHAASKPNAGDVARRDVLCCQFGDPASDTMHRMRSQGSSVSVAVDTHGIVFGLVFLDTKPGPRTFFRSSRSCTLGRIPFVRTNHCGCCWRECTPTSSSMHSSPIRKATFSAFSLDARLKPSFQGEENRRRAVLLPTCRDAAGEFGRVV